MKALVLAKRFSQAGEDPWLVDELVAALRDKDVEVDVFLMDLSGRWSLGKHISSNKVSIMAFPVFVGNKFLRMSSFILGVSYFILFSVLNKKRYDFIFSFSVGSIFWPVAKLLSIKNKKGLSVFFLWDFFPIHQYEIGKIKNRYLLKIFSWLERVTIDSFDYVCLMSKANLQFFFRTYPRFKGGTFVFPVWGRVEKNHDTASSPNFSGSRLKVVFGGQLARGRGVEDIVKLARKIDEVRSPIDLFVVGDGELKWVVDDYISGVDGSGCLRCLGRVPRKEYKKFLSGCDVGLVVTVPCASVPTFPSKVIDYFSAGLPVLACVEAESDFVEFIESEACAGIGVAAGDVEAMHAALVELFNMKTSGLLAEIGANGHEYYLNNMQSDILVDFILSLEKTG